MPLPFVVPALCVTGGEDLRGSHIDSNISPYEDMISTPYISYGAAFSYCARLVGWKITSSLNYSDVEKLVLSVAFCKVLD